MMSTFSKLAGNRFVKFGAPFVLFVVGGSFLLQNVTDIRYKVSEHNRSYGLTDEEQVIRLYKKAEPEKDIFEEYQEMKDNIDLDNWSNVRGPRPWEKDEQKYMDIIQQRINESEKKKKNKGSFWAG